MTRARLLAAVSFLCLGLAVPEARAADPREAARAALKEGNDFLDKGEAQSALDSFRRALELSGSPKVHFNFGQAYRALGSHEVQAYEAFQRFLEQAKDAPPGTRAEAERESSELRRHLGSLSVQTEPPGARISVDGIERGKSPLAVVVPPGTHTVSAELPDYLAATAEPFVLLAGGEVKQILKLAAKLVEVPAQVTKETAPPPPPPVTSPKPRPVTSPGLDLRSSVAPTNPDPPVYRRWWFWTAIAGAAGLAVAGTLLATRGDAAVVRSCSATSTSGSSTGICDPLP